MSLYSSREPFNDDPYPNVWAGHSERNQMRTDTDMFRKGAPSYLGYEGNYVVRPRPEYNRPQNNPTNPILTCFREYAEGRVGWLAAHWTSTDEMWSEMVLKDEKLDEHMGSSEQEGHARKVLTRLAALKKEES